MNATETNKIIAEFIGWEYKVLPVYSDDKFLGRKNIYNTPFKKHLKNKAFTTTFSENELVFHKDWNWLMEVVEKIYQTNLYYDKYIDFNSSMFSSGKIELSTNKEAVYNDCLEFIKWYNENKI